MENDGHDVFSIEWWEQRRAQAILIHAVYYQMEGENSENAKYYHKLYKWIKERIRKKNDE